MGRALAASHVSPLVSGGAEGLYALAYDESASLDSSCGSLANTRGRLLYRDDSFGRTWFSYDAWGRTVREVRLRTGTTSCAGATAYQTPHTLYSYSANGNLTQVTYPYGRTVNYTYGTGGLADRVSSISVQTWSSSGSASTPLVSQVTWEPYGGLRGYRTYYAISATTGSIEYALGDNSSAAPASCPSAPPSVTSGDATGRLRALWVSTLASGVNFTPGSGNGSVLKQLYTWQADQLIRADTCLLGTSSPRIETYGYDGQLRLTSGTSTLTTQGGPFSTRAFSHDSRGNRITESGEANTWTLGYSNLGHPDQLASRYSNQAGSQLGYSYYYDADGRVSSKQWHAGPNSSAFSLNFTSGPTSSGATDSVFKSVNVEGLTYNYFYDGTGKRRLKDYPTGIKDEYFYNGNKGLLVDQGNSSTLAASMHPVDEYVWLDDRPIAVIRGKLDASWSHLSDTTADCKRLDEAASCGIYHLVTDYLGKPVLMLDSQGRVTGTGEYDAFGHVNRVSVDIESPHPYTTSTGVLGAIMKQPTVAGTTLSQRVLIDSLDLWRDADDCPSGGVPDIMDYLYINDVASSSRLTDIAPYYDGRMWTEWVMPGAAGIQASIANSGVSQCIQGQVCSGINCNFTCTCTVAAPNAEKAYSGVVISAYEYRRVQTGASYFWTPLRMPGQYHDIETDLFENWNRFYDPGTGKYLQPEPIMRKPGFVKAKALQGTGALAYAYANNNAVGFTDPSGLYTVDKECKLGATNDMQIRVKSVAGGISDKCLRDCVVKRVDSMRFQCAGDYFQEVCKDPARIAVGRLGESCNRPESKAAWCNRPCSDESAISAIVHEAAHNCGWNHTQGKNVPGNDGHITCTPKKEETDIVLP
nr:RHS repeat-associated core domain-containing protein [Myxococcus sp. AM011]